MIKNVYVIYDSQAEFYNQPFFLINDEIALRSALDLRNDPGTEIGRHPQDFTMFKIGTYDDTTAVLDTDQAREVICRFHELPIGPIPGAEGIPKQPKEQIINIEDQKNATA